MGEATSEAEGLACYTPGRYAGEVAGFTTWAVEQLVTGTLYLALFEDAPGPGGGGTEASYAGYARVSHASWVTVGNERRNNGAVSWAVVPSDTTIGWWGIFDAAVGGNLIAWGPFLDAGGDPAEFIVSAGDYPRMIDQDLRIVAEE